MCGLAAIFCYNNRSPRVSTRELTLMQQQMRNRGPDSEGVWVGDSVGLAHTRLAIVDLSDAGRQPMADEISNSVLVYNGEIYNFGEIKTELERKGYVFHSKTDTEVLLYLYREKGEKIVNYLHGMYAFVIWDANRKVLFCARDPYGIKPLYYSDDGKTLRIASEVKALRASDAISNERDPAGICGFYLFGHVPEPYTSMREIKALPAGSILRCPFDGRPDVHTFFSVASAYVDARAQACDATVPGRFNKAIRESVIRHMVADVPVGVFLSSGIDSGAVLGMMRDVFDGSIDAFTVSFDEYRGTKDDEVPLASLVADYYDARHRPYVFTRDQIIQLMPEFLEAMDQPTIDGLNTWLVSRVVKEHGCKVVLSGLGGDELLGGYPSFRDIPRTVRMLRFFNKLPKLGERFRQIVSGLHSAGLPVNPKLAGLLLFGGSYAGAYLLRRGLFMPWELQSLVGLEFAHEGLLRLSPIARIQEALRPDPETDYGRVAVLESTCYLRNQLLRDADWAGMDNSLEIRTPLVDAKLLGEIAPLVVDSDGRTSFKKLLANAPHNALPDKLQNRTKTGFTLPISGWLESMPALDTWRGVPLLARDSCHWARRWAYTVMSPIMHSC